MMNGAGSRIKGNSFERKISKILSEHYPGFVLRRVPSSGGLDIKCDIYDPKNDNFPLFVECKHRKTFSISTLMGGSSELFDMFDKIEADCSRSYLNKKYQKGPVPVVIFKGGNFQNEMVMFNPGYLYDLFGDLFKRTPMMNHMILNVDSKLQNNGYAVVTLKDFLAHSKKGGLVLRAS